MLPEDNFVDSEGLADALTGGDRAGGGAESELPGWIVVAPSGGDTFRLASRLEEKTRAAGGVTLTAHWRNGLLRPFGALLDVVEDLAAWAQPRQPELLQRFGWSLVNLLYPWRKNEAALPVGELRAGLADLVLRGDQNLVHQFFQKRNVRPQILSYLVHFLFETSAAAAAASSSPVTLCLEDAHLADEFSLSVIQLLNRYTRSKRIPLRICVIAERAPGSAFDGLLGRKGLRQEWRVVQLSEGAAESPLEGLCGRLSPEQVERLEAATVFGLPFTLSSWAEVLPAGLRAAAPAAADQMVAHGLLRRVGDDRLRFAHGQLLKDVERGLTPEKRQALHAWALESEESEDAFAAAWHAAEGRCSDRLRRYCLSAMERAWAVSAYDCAITFAERALAAPADGSDINEDLLLAMVNYEAGRYEDAHRLLRAALVHPSDRIDRNLIEYLLGYNAVFGLADYKQGIEVLSRVLKHYEEKGDERGEAYIRNSLAFAHFCSRNVDEAISLEELNINQFKKSRVTDSFLANVLQLNLGRLYRNSGEAARALKLLREGLFARRAELSSHALLLYYATLGNFQFSQGDYRGALAAYYHAFELVRNMQLDSVKDQVLLALSKRAPELPHECASRADELLYYIHFHLGLTCNRLGLETRAAAYLAAIRHKVALLGEDVVNAVEASFMAEGHAPAIKGDPPVDFDRGVADVMGELSGLVREAADEGDTVGWIASALESGQVVAVLRPRHLGDNIRVTESVVIYDPRRRDVAERMSQELEAGGSQISRATAALLSPEATDLFIDIAPFPLVQQSATLRPEHRADFPALLAVRVCVQVLSPEFDDFLFDIVRAFARKTGVGMLAAAPFHLWRRDLAVMPQQGLLNFLVSSIDALALGDRVVLKVHGSTGVENLLDFRPRLSEEALIIKKGAGNSPGGGAILIRIKRRGGYATDDMLKLHPGTSTILDLCDGSLSVAQVMERISGPWPAGRDERVSTFLRSLWRRGALCFDEPTGAAESAPQEV